MLFAALTLMQLLDRCAPEVGRRTMSAIVQVESGGNPLAIRDNTLDRTFVPQDARQALAWANQLLALHHSIDLGISQINSANLPKLGLSVSEAFDPCRNVQAGATILTADYRAASSEFGQGQYALRRAIGAYNSGSLYAGERYIVKILAAAGIAGGEDFSAREFRTAVQPAPRAGAAANPPTPDPNSAPIAVAPSGAAAPPALIWANAGGARAPIVASAPSAPRAAPSPVPSPPATALASPEQAQPEPSPSPEPPLRETLAHGP
jgi:type IV secretion system protein VirB1